jgi:ABC-type transport system involved in cytochrome bd biosynthesis fused ATPase/permease subunit
MVLLLYSDKSSLKNLTINFLDKGVNALVGESGSGKSTIVQLLLRYYDCTRGALTIAGKNIRGINIHNYRRKIGFVGQEPVLFAMTIADNMRIADPKLSKEEIIHALKKANAWEFCREDGARDGYLRWSQRGSVVGRAKAKDRHSSCVMQEPSYPNFGRGHVCPRPQELKVDPINPAEPLFF